MSSPGSDVLTVELPRRLASDRVAAGLIVAAVFAAGAVAARNLAGPAGTWTGIAAGVGLAGWMWWRGRHAARVRSATIDTRGRWHLRLSDGQLAPAVLLPGSRVLGRTVVLRLRAGRVARSAWLTSWDLPDEALREITIRLRACAVPQGAGLPQGTTAPR
jgi:hypothetical protein